MPSPLFLAVGLSVLAARARAAEQTAIDLWMPGFTTNEQHGELLMSRMMGEIIEEKEDGNTVIVMTCPGCAHSIPPLTFTAGPSTFRNSAALLPDRTEVIDCKMTGCPRATEAVCVLESISGESTAWVATTTVDPTNLDYQPLTLATPLPEERTVDCAVEQPEITEAPEATGTDVPGPEETGAASKRSVTWTGALLVAGTVLSLTL